MLRLSGGLCAVLLGGLIACSSGSSDRNDSAPVSTITVSREPVEPVALDERSRSAARLAASATFGVDDRVLRDILDAPDHAAWIDAQIALPPSRHLPYTEANSNGSNGRARHEIWWQHAVTAPDQLRQRVAFAWSQIFVVSDLDYTLSNSQYGMASFQDLLVEHAFGTYRELLEAVTLHPVMGIYLSMLRNEKADEARNVRPDENFAREVLQLFSIGLHELEPDGRALPEGAPRPAYTQAVVQDFARVFTGWNFAGTDQWQSIDLTPFDKRTPMVPNETYHDTGSKTLLRGEVVPAGLDARADLNAALDNIAAHPNVGPFIGTRLIERLVTSNPSTGYVQRVAAVFDDDGQGVRGNLAAVTRAILLDAEASNPSDGGKLKEPVLRLSHLMRALDATPGARSDGVYNGAARSADRVDEVYGQGIMRSPSVFNFFQPDAPLSSSVRSADDDPRVAPEAQIMTESFVALANNDLHELVYDHHSRSDADDDTVVLDVDKPLRLLAESDEALIDWLELVVLGGHASPTLRAELLEHIASLTPLAEPATADLPPRSPELALSIVLDALFISVASPDHYVQ